LTVSPLPRNSALLGVSVLFLPDLVTCAGLILSVNGTIFSRSPWSNAMILSCATRGVRKT
jgi:hypothetical protein